MGGVKIERDLLYILTHKVSQAKQESTNLGNKVDVDAFPKPSVIQKYFKIVVKRSNYLSSPCTTLP